MKFLEAKFVKGFIRMCDDGWNQGWHERNGGNLSYRVKPEEVGLVKENFNTKLDNRNQVKIKKISMIFHGFYCTLKIPEEKALFFRVV